LLEQLSFLCVMLCGSHMSGRHDTCQGLLNFLRFLLFCEPQPALCHVLHKNPLTCVALATRPLNYTSRSLRSGSGCHELGPRRHVVGGAATAAGIIHRMLARHEHGRSLQDDADCRRGDYFEGYATDHDVLPDYRREHYRTLSHRRLALGPLPVMAGHKHHYPGCKSATVQTGRTRPLILEMTEPDEASTEARALYAEPAGLCL